MVSLRFLGVCSALVVFGVGCGAGEAWEDGRGSFAIVGGTAEPGCPAVVSLGYRDSAGFCSGTLVTPRLVFTAGHCVGTGPAAELMVYFGDGPPIDPGIRVAAEKTVSHPDKDLSDARNPQYDVAVVYLAEDAPTEPMAVSWSALTTADVGRAVRWVGFGYAGASAPNRVKRSAVIPIAGVGEPWFYGTDEGGMAACGGDSGGAAIDERGVSPRLTGIIHGSGDQCEEGSVAMRIDHSSAFLQEHFLLAGGELSPDEPDSAGGGRLSGNATGQATGAVWLFGALLFAAWRQRLKVRAS